MTNSAMSLLLAVGAMVQTIPVVTVADFLASEPQARRRVLGSIHADAPETGTVELLIEGLKDETLAVRIVAMQSASAFVRRQNGRTRVNKQIVDLEPLITALISSVEDSEYGIRAGAVAALGSYRRPFPTAVESALTSRFFLEDHPVVRSVIVYELGQSGRAGAAVTRVIVAALQDTSDSVRRSAGLSTALVRPPAAIPHLVRELESGNLDTRAEFVQALASFGSIARPHLDVLRRLLYTEERPSHRGLIERSIQAIGSDK
jgi:HEAT repeat protein